MYQMVFLVSASGYSMMQLAHYKIKSLRIEVTEQHYINCANDISRLEPLHVMFLLRINVYPNCDVSV